MKNRANFIELRTFIYFIIYKPNLFIFGRLQLFYKGFIMLGANVFDAARINDDLTKAYSMPQTELNFVQCVRELVKSDSYQELFSVDNHLVALEDIRRKLTMITLTEAHTGIMNWNLKEKISDINDLLARLQQKRRLLFLDLN